VVSVVKQVITAQPVPSELLPVSRSRGHKEHLHQTLSLCHHYKQCGITHEGTDKVIPVGEQEGSGERQSRMSSISKDMLTSLTSGLIWAMMIHVSIILPG